MDPARKAEERNLLACHEGDDHHAWGNRRENRPSPKRRTGLSSRTISRVSGDDVTDPSERAARTNPKTRVIITRECRQDAAVVELSNSRNDELKSPAVNGSRIVLYPIEKIYTTAARLCSPELRHTTPCCREAAIVSELLEPTWKVETR